MFYKNTNNTSCCI